MEFVAAKIILAYLGDEMNQKPKILLFKHFCKSKQLDLDVGSQQFRGWVGTACNHSIS